LAEWFASEAWRIYSTLRETGDQRQRRTLLEWIAARGGRVSAKQLQDSLRSRYPSAEDAKAALDALVEAKLGEWQDAPSGPKGGRPTKWFVLVPRNRETRETLVDGNAESEDQTRETVRETQDDPIETPF
jgi:hypothetical protein